ncbi:hypothetical protein HU200_038163 [Digitaria exilis]|uniref:Uncharacterized protein n=1 Tax=Digitaria exilis TaxID=1010633 RepID=A0A835BDC2_9POAL|nr:hypothetical protein HU200_038163 [Digitaria exilis]
MGVRRSYQQIANEVEAAYDVVLDEKWRGANKSRFVEMMVTDGCFLLELIRIHIVLEDSKVDTGYATNDPIFSIRNYDELREAGIQFKKSDTKSIHSIDFKNGVLSMPQLELYDNTETALLSLMAFEWLHPDAEDDVASYVSFMDQIIESERDVSLLRSKGILVNLIGSDKMVVETFHTLTKLSWSGETNAWATCNGC